MDVILVPGLWLDESSWQDVAPGLIAAGHTVRALTLPGVGKPADASAGIGISDWVAAVVAAVDDTTGPVALVGHSGGGNVVWGATDARPGRIDRVIFLDAFPPAAGSPISEFPVVDGVVPFPGWDFFDEPDVADLDQPTRSTWAARTASVPAQVPTDPLPLSNPQRLSVPVVMLSGTMTEADIRGLIEAAPEWASDLATAENLRILELHSGHWPQFSAPDRTTQALLEALR